MKKYEIPNKFMSNYDNQVFGTAKGLNENFKYLIDTLNTQRDVIRNLQEEIKEI
jgi:hypothetical protein